MLYFDTGFRKTLIVCNCGLLSRSLRLILLIDHDHYDVNNKIIIIIIIIIHTLHTNSQIYTSYEVIWRRLVTAGSTCPLLASSTEWITSFSSVGNISTSCWTSSSFTSTRGGWGAMWGGKHNEEVGEGLEGMEVSEGWRHNEEVEGGREG